MSATAAPEAVSADSGAQPASPPTPSPALADLQTLATIARLHQVSADPQALLHGLGKSLHDPFTPQDRLLVAKSLGLKAKPAASMPERLKLAPLPALALAQCDGQRVLLICRLGGPVEATIAVQACNSECCFSSKEIWFWPLI